MPVWAKPQPIDLEEMRQLTYLEELTRRNLPIPPELLQAARLRELRRRGRAFDTFQRFVDLVNPTLSKFEHIPKLISVGQRIVDRVLDRVLVLMPPRYFKSEVFSKLLPAYYLMREPKARVAISSYTATLAWEMSAAARDNFIAGTEGASVTQLSEAGSKHSWSTMQGGGLWAVGMGGTLVGRGYHLGIMDDPISPEHASSPLYQRRFAHWWPDTWLSRQEPHMSTGQQLAQVVVVMQRLGPSDPVDFLLRREVGEQMEAAPQHWHVVVMDEIKSGEPLGRWKGPRGLPPTCTIEEDDRPTGAVLAPTRFTQEAVTSAQSGAGPLASAAQRQQRPMQATGLFWRSDWFATYDTLPANAYDGGTDWDTAYSQEEGNAASAFVRSFRGPTFTDGRPQDEFPIYIDDLGWEWQEFPGLVTWIKRTAGPHFVEAKASGKSAVQQLRAHGIIAKEVTVLGDKLARASVAQPVVSNGRVLVRASILQKLLWGERQGLLRVTAEGLQLGGSEGLDVNDAFVQALHRHCQLSEKKRRVMFR